MTSGLLLNMALTAALAADPGPRVTTQWSPLADLWVGRRITLVVTLYTPDLFAGSPSFDLPAVDGAIVIAPAGSPVVGNETIDDVTYTTQRHELAVYAARPGPVRIPPLTIRFDSNAGFGKPIVARRVTTEPIAFTAQAPPGSERLGTVIATSSLTLTDHWSPEPRHAKVGDAFTRTITISADDVPGMLFPSFRVDSVDGLAAYPKPPSVDDQTNRGTLTGRRTETVTYACESAGTVTVPARTFTWYDLDDKRLRTEIIASRTITVAAAPAAMNPQQGDVAGSAVAPNLHLPYIFSAFVVLVSAVSVGVFVVRRRRPQNETEATAFARLRRAGQGHDPHAVFTALTAWLDRCGIGSFDELARRSGDPSLSRRLTDLEARVYLPPTTPGDPAWSAGPLVGALAQFRNARRRGGAINSRPLPPMNPVG